MGRQRSLESTLPTFKLGDDYSTEFGPDNKEVQVIEVICQRSWCQGVFVVSVKHWWKKNLWERKKEKGDYPYLFKGGKLKFRTRPCPYCHNWHKMPKKPAHLRKAL